MAKISASTLAESVFALLIMELRERNVLGVALEGDQLRRDVAQVTVSFTKHRLVDPTATEDETRRLLKRRAFDHLLTLALGGIAESHGERSDLEHERTLLHNKIAALASGHWVSATTRIQALARRHPIQKHYSSASRKSTASSAALAPACCSRISTC